MFIGASTGALRYCVYTCGFVRHSRLLVQHARAAGIIDKKKPCLFLIDRLLRHVNTDNNERGKRNRKMADPWPDRFVHTRSHVTRERGPIGSSPVDRLRTVLRTQKHTLSSYSKFALDVEHVARVIKLSLFTANNTTACNTLFTVSPFVYSNYHDYV